MMNPLFVTVKHPEKPAVKTEIVAYYNKLQHGQGHTTRAKVYGNFSINYEEDVKQYSVSACTEFCNFIQF